jgi:hypothetical protein
VVEVVEKERADDDASLYLLACEAEVDEEGMAKDHEDRHGVDEGSRVATDDGEGAYSLDR